MEKSKKKIVSWNFTMLSAKQGKRFYPVKSQTIQVGSKEAKISLLPFSRSEMSSCFKLEIQRELMRPSRKNVSMQNLMSKRRY